MGSLTHIAARTAAGIGIDQTLKKVSRGDRETELLKLIDLMEKYVAGSSIQVNGDAYRNLIKDENSALSRYINRALDEVDHNVLRTTVLNFGFEAMLNGTITIRKMRAWDTGKGKWENLLPKLVFYDFKPLPFVTDEGAVPPSEAGLYGP